MSDGTRRYPPKKKKDESVRRGVQPAETAAGRRQRLLTYVSLARSFAVIPSRP